jgi:hypothetical protein
MSHSWAEPSKRPRGPCTIVVIEEPTEAPTTPNATSFSFPLRGVGGAVHENRVRNSFSPEEIVDRFCDRHLRFLHELLNQLPSLFVAHPHRLMDQHAALESRILGVKARPWVSIAVEEPDWDFLTPF